MPHWTLTDQPIRTLEEHQVFVFGANRGRRNPQGQRHSPDGGFHGAGGAGVAFRGTPGAPRADHPDHWSRDPAFLRAKAAPRGHPDRVGRWAVFGVCRGPMLGREGKSYAVYTVVAPGLRRSIPLPEIHAQLQALVTFAAERPHLEFLVSPLGEGYAGYTQADMDALWDSLPLPANLTFIRLRSGPPRDT